MAIKKSNKKSAKKPKVQKNSNQQLIDAIVENNQLLNELLKEIAKIKEIVNKKDLPKPEKPLQPIDWEEIFKKIPKIPEPLPCPPVSPYEPYRPFPYRPIPNSPYPGAPDPYIGDPIPTWPRPYPDIICKSPSTITTVEPPDEKTTTYYNPRTYKTEF